MISCKNLIAGQNFVLEHHDLHISIIPDYVPAGLALDTSAFLLNERDKVSSDNDFIFFNQPARLDQGIELDCNSHKLTLHLNGVASSVKKIVFTSTIFQGNEKNQSFKDLKKITVLVKDFLTGMEIAAFVLDTSTFSETALIFSELYRHQNTWKFRAVGSGFVGGLEPLAKHYGVVVGEGEASSSEPDPVPATPPPKPINLSKITLEKKGQSISLDKKPQGQLGKLQINLNWNSKPIKSTGFFSRSQGGGIDLDLGCLFEFQEGSIGGIQALGNSFGNLHRPPYIELDQDDRSGTSVAGENLIINGDFWHLFRRILVFTFIYEGIPNWSHVDAKITFKCNDQSDIEVRLDSHRNDQTMCAIAMLENIDNRVSITKLVEYFRDHQSMDLAYGWGLNYSRGSK
ncbi:TerD family protein [Methylicorpusculum sp.]|uniref:TerD family protein n=1 Tax=Methylicorpusculum sp. TaxID=2713644 RepID=UPI002730B71D|nr:TerD family protein [Methylicorpusculum sp.]MDP2177221.1 TerD family protein [Methylicorpusculum sp.]MDP3531146.1 TerD family protein [Methylicorpusculum sp.]MDZ4154701.1 TerD family protein [Methylicorpusculum sp.]